MSSESLAPSLVAMGEIFDLKAKETMIMSHSLTHVLIRLGRVCLLALFCTALLGLPQCSSDDNGGNGSGTGDPPSSEAIYFWITDCSTMGNMIGGTCNGSQSGVAGADALCEARASDAGLPSPSGFAYSHYAMLHRGETGGPAHPRNLNIPNKEREIRSVDNTIVANHYDMSGGNNDYWDASYTLQNVIPARMDSMDSTRTIFYAWSGLISSGVGDNCSDWKEDSGSSSIGGSYRSSDRFNVDGHSSFMCDQFQYPIDLAVGLLCASY